MHQGSTWTQSKDRWFAAKRSGARSPLERHAGRLHAAITREMGYSAPAWSPHYRNVLRDQMARRLALDANGDLSDHFAIIGQFASYARPVQRARLPGDLDVEVAGRTTASEAAELFRKRVLAHNTAVIGFDDVRLVRTRPIPSCVLSIDAHIGDREFHNLHVDMAFNRPERVGATQRIDGVLPRTQPVVDGMLTNPYYALSDEHAISKKIYGAAFLSSARPRDAVDLFVLLHDPSVATDIDGSLVWQALQSKLRWDAQHCDYALTLTQLPDMFQLDKQAVDHELRMLGSFVSAADIECSLNDELIPVLSGLCRGHTLRNGQWTPTVPGQQRIGTVRVGGLVG